MKATTHPSSTSDEKGNYYYSNGQRQPLVREPSVFAVSYRLGRNSRDPALSRRAFRLLQEQAENVGFIPNYGLQIYQTLPVATRRNGAAQSEIVAEVKQLNTETPIDSAAVAYRRHPEASSDQIDDLMFVTREFVAQFKPGVSRQQIDQLNAQHEVQIVEPLGYAENGYRLKASEAEGERGPVVLANLYYESGLTEFAHPNFVRRRHLREPALLGSKQGANSAIAKQKHGDRSIYLSQQWHLQTANVVNAWNVTRGDRAIKVAILDDGVDVGHPEFADKVAAQFDFASGNTDGSPNSTFDSHGTACAGVAVAQGLRAFGAAPNCSLIAVRYPDFLGVAEEAEMFRWTADNGADIVSCSWGPEDGTGAVDPLPDSVRAAIRYCATQGRNGLGVPIFWAAGNGNESLSNDGYAANPDVMAIAASSSRDRRSWYSDFGTEVFICAPSSGDSSLGEQRIFTVDRRGNIGYNPDPKTGASHPPNDHDYTDSFGGTSSATPLVAGVASLMLSINPRLRRQDVQQILRETADKIDTTGGNYDSQGHSQLYGYGRVNALRAVERARDFGGQTPVPDQPAISAPASINRNGPSPTFQIDTGGRQLYAVELATRHDLFNNAAHGSDRRANNFYGSWQDGLLSQAPYTLPDTVWERLKPSDRLFYRLHAADSASWDNYAVTISDSASSSAPSIEIQSVPSSPTPGSSSPSISTASSTSRSGAPPTFQIQTGGRQLYAVELAARSELFNNSTHGSDRNASNFYGSWQNELLSQAPYVLPSSVWNQLKHNDRLFYRLHVADSASWDNYAVTVSDTQAALAPSLQILGSATPPDNGSGSPAMPRRSVTFPSGATFDVVDTPADSIDYSDSVGNGSVPLIEVRDRLDENLSRNFKTKEFAARDRVRYARISTDLVEGLQRVRDRVGASVTVNSGYRHPALNQEVDGASSSQHIAGRAADIRTSAMTPLELARIALQELGCDIGIGLGRNSIHVDLRDQLTSWRYDGAELSEDEFDQWVRNTCQQLNRRRNARQAGRREFGDRIGPAIAGPEQYSKQAEAPAFCLHLGINPYFAVEVAVHLDLFKDQFHERRSHNNFYGSWITEGLLESDGKTVYRLPEAAWHQLRVADRLYYRVITSSTPAPTWSDVRSSIPKGQIEDAPWIRLPDDRWQRTANSGTSYMELGKTRQTDEARWRA